MTYYLGKVGKLVSSCKDLYYDVNAAYLTGAVDVVVVRQADGSLKSTPFHVRFGKLGVLRTGDLMKEVEIEVNGKLIDLKMKLDESGSAFFVKPKTECGLKHGEESSVDRSKEDQMQQQLLQLQQQESTSIDIASLRSLLEDENRLVRHKTLSEPGARSLSPEFYGRGTDITHIRRESDPLSSSLGSPRAQYSSTEEVVGSALALGQGMIPSSQSLPIDIKRTNMASSHLRSHSYDEGDRCSGGEGEEGEGEGEGEEEGIGVWSSDTSHSLPTTMDTGVLSDSAVETDGPEFLEPHPVGVATTLSDTEVEVKDRLSSKLWAWSHLSRPRPTSQGEPTSAAVRVSSSSEGAESYRHPQATQAPAHHIGFWGTLAGMLKRRRGRRFSSVENGIYLDQLEGDKMDAEELSMFFPLSDSRARGGGRSNGSSSSQQQQQTHLQQHLTGGGETGTSGVGTSPPSPSPPPSSSSSSPTPPHHHPHQHQHSPHLHSHPPSSHTSTSTFGTGQGTDDMDKFVASMDDIGMSLCGGLGQGDISEDAFLNSLLSFDKFCEDPDVLTNPNLVIRMGGRYYNWQVAAPMIMSAVVYLHLLPKTVRDSLEKKHMERKKTRQSFWYFWGKGREEHNSSPTHEAKSEGATPIGSPRKWMKPSEVLSSDEELPPGPSPPPPRPRQRSFKRKKQHLTNRLTPEQLAKLPLKPGANEVVFSITTRYQGTAKATSTIFLWSYTDKLVVSDIDGTITRSDVAGQVLPYLGKDWTHNGVVELFSALDRNGYRLVYLTARAIGQASYTKEFLHSIRRGNRGLPKGPIFLMPFSLYVAFKKEVIERRPDEFKTKCLQELRAVFPPDVNPFHSGFGNKHTDAKSYQEVDIPTSRIFTVNPKGHVKCQLFTAFQSSYTDLMSFVESQFPPVHCSSPAGTGSREEYSTFNYWRDPIPTNIDTASLLLDSL